MCISQDQAEAFLKSDLARFEECVNRCVTVPLTQDMFDALVSFTYNVGTGALQRSTLLCKLNRGDTEGAAKEFDKWVHAGKKVFPGLVRRRREEKELFLRNIP